MEQTNLLTVKEAAKLLNINPETLRRWDNTGKLAAIKVGTRGDRRYRVKDIMAAKRRINPTVCEGYQITLFSFGFEAFVDRFGLVAIYIVRKVSQDGVPVAGFAFAVAGLDMFANPHINEHFLEKQAMNVIHKAVTEDGIENLKEYTYEWQGSSFVEIKNAKWWTYGLKL